MGYKSDTLLRESRHQIHQVALEVKETLPKEMTLDPFKKFRPESL
jgi:hypothetical protein